MALSPGITSPNSAESRCDAGARIGSDHGHGAGAGFAFGSCLGVIGSSFVRVAQNSADQRSQRAVSVRSRTLLDDIVLKVPVIMVGLVWVASGRRGAARLVTATGRSARRSGRAAGTPWPARRRSPSPG